MRDTGAGSWWKQVYNYGADALSSTIDYFSPEPATSSFLNISQSPRTIQTGLGTTTTTTNYDDPNSGWGWLEDAYDYAKTGWDYLGDAGGWLKDRYQDLPKPLQDWVKGRLIKKDDLPQGGGGQPKPRPSYGTNRADMSSSVARFTRGQTGKASINSGVNSNVYANNPFASAITRNAAAIQEIKNLSVSQVPKGSQTITVNQARNAIYTHLHKRA